MHEGQVYKQSQSSVWKLFCSFLKNDKQGKVSRGGKKQNLQAKSIFWLSLFSNVKVEPPLFQEYLHWIYFTLRLIFLVFTRIGAIHTFLDDTIVTMVFTTNNIDDQRRG